MKQNIFSRKEVKIQLSIFMVVGVMAFFISGYFDILERLFLFLEAHEEYELDELIVVIICWTGLLFVLTINKTKALHNQNIKIDRLSNDLKEQIKSRDTLQSILAHDLKAPFNPIIGLSELLITKNDQLDSKTQMKFLEMINKASRSTYNLLEDILEWSSIKHGKLTPIYERIRISSLVDDSINLMENPATKKRIKIISDIPQDVYVCGDINMIKTVVRNLLSNAIKFSGEGLNIKITSNVEFEKIKLIFSDKGIGISKQKIDEIYAGKVTSTEGTQGESGTGLGLVVCREFISLNNGVMDITSEPGVGSTFSFTLPIIQAD